jgi:hypothetical protein
MILFAGPPAFAGSLRPARILGLAPGLFALTSCAAAWVRGRRAPRPNQLASILTLLEAALVLDTIFNGRWLVHNWLEGLAKADNLYAARSGPQHLALELLAYAVAIVAAWSIWRLRRRPGAALAALGGILSAACWCVEVISLHTVDAFLYQTMHGVTLVRLIWAACSLITGVGILWDTFAPHRVNAASTTLSY